MCKYCEKSTYVGDFECVYDEGELPFAQFVEGK